MGPHQIYLMISLVSALALILIFLRMLQIFRRRGETRRLIRLTRECFRDIESQAQHLRMRREQTSRDGLPYSTAATGWESEKRTFISNHLRPKFEEIRSESDRATAAEQCSRFIEFIASSPVADHDGAGAEEPAAKVLAHS
ncbi:hypothetical protein N5W20_05260 [Candidatus Kirkpatrickella diaphorinae]|uniref:Uncharacterized protein n=1 Tax=Candidatus Kirkpatrickella diaphorinae TaxID=2984322 RepID=A0ABY6GGC3_9PROT|nr:hypothetical protein [Candidatus Kirkpatrickella diaphorinae]UYH50537.1 hypothetical protein N5W20_05260 [Candidatus Kirkpatrickella diaphorinae]